ncbi:MAG: class I SAM-dependent methyltransferase [Pyrinomonadaceae bacterium]
MAKKPDYGIDAMPVVRNLALVGIGAAILFALSFAVPTLIEFRRMFAGFTVWFSLTATALVAYAKFGKIRHRDRMLAMVEWRGDEMVLDVGTGRGLLMIGAATKLNSGRSFGVDIFNAADLSGNKLENTLSNAEAEGVASKIEVRNDDARTLSFPADFFDVIVSNLCIHNIPNAEGRRQACDEIVRVLKPGGTALISDFINTALYANAFRQAGLKTEKFGPYLFDTFPPLRIIKAQK